MKIRREGVEEEEAADVVEAESFGRYFYLVICGWLLLLPLS